MPNFGHAHLKLGEHLQQIGLEGRIGPVDLVDQQNRRPEGIGLQRREQRPLDQEALAENVLGQGVAPGAAAFGQANREHLGGVVPLVDGGSRVEALVALQAQLAAAQGLGQRRGKLSLAAAGLAFQQQRAAEGEAQVEGLDQRIVRDVAPFFEQRPCLGFAARQRPHVVGHGAVSYPHRAGTERCRLCPITALARQGVVRLHVRRREVNGSGRGTR